MTNETFTMIAQIATPLIFLGMIPWAMNVGNKLAKISTTLEMMGWQEKAISELREEITNIKVRLAKLG